MFGDPDIALFIEVFGLNPRSMRGVDILWNAMEKAADSVDNLDTTSGTLFDDVPVDTALSRRELIDLIRSDLEEAKARRESGEFNQEVRTDIPPIAEAPDFELITVAKDKDGTEHRVLGVNGNPDLAMMPEGVEGIKPLPVRLQEETVKRGHIKGHLNELKKVGYESVEQAVWDISKNYEAIYEGSQEGGLVLARELPENGDIKGVLLVKLQDIAGCYRVGSVFISNSPKYLKNRELLWGTTQPIRLQRENPPRTREFTGPKGVTDDSILSNIEKEINTLKTGGSSDELFQAEGGDQIGPIADRLRQSKERDNIIKPSGGKRYANPDADEHARIAERLRNQEPRDFRQGLGKQEGQYFTARYGRANTRRVQRLDGNSLQTRGGARVLARALSDDSASKSVLLVKLQDVAGCYRVERVLISNNPRYLKHRRLLWGTTLPIRLQQENLPRTQGLTGPKGNSDGPILSNIEKEINILKAGNSSDEWEIKNEDILFDRQTRDRGHLS